MAIKKPVARTTKGRKEVVVSHGVRSAPGSAFDRRHDGGVDPMYVGPSVVQKRGSGMGSGSGQQKKHKSSGKGQ